jgi:hypothetical protein
LIAAFLRRHVCVVAIRVQSFAMSRLPAAPYLHGVCQLVAPSLEHGEVSGSQGLILGWSEVGSLVFGKGLNFVGGYEGLPLAASKRAEAGFASCCNTGLDNSVDTEQNIRLFVK